MQSLTEVNETENVGHSDPIFISICIKIYPYMNIDDWKTSTSRKMELNAEKTCLKFMKMATDLQKPVKNT